MKTVCYDGSFVETTWEFEAGRIITVLTKGKHHKVLRESYSSGYDYDAFSDVAAAQHRNAVRAHIRALWIVSWTASDGDDTAAPWDAVDDDGVLR